MRSRAAGRLASAISALVCLGPLGLPAAARTDGPLSPTRAQVQALSHGNPDDPIALVRLLKTQDPAGFTGYMLALETELAAVGAARAYGGRIAQEMAGGDLPYDAIVIDLFPTRRGCVQSLRAVDPMVESLGIRDAFVLAVRPWSTSFRVAAGAAASVLGSFPRAIGNPPPFPQSENAGGPEIAPDAEAIAAFNQASQDNSFAMLNLNLFRAKAAPPPGDDADAGATGEEAYTRYGRTALWHVLRRGGRLLFEGQPIGVVVGAAGNPLDRAWSQLALVYYPSRKHMRDMLADPDYRAAVPHRVAGLERAALLVTEPWPPFDPGRARE
ncbi:MAG TPA: hypothetical protein VMS55_22495 [Myxococcota bacterium]|nr:hypothetical protein [Myxococcota bacterium]